MSSPRQKMVVVASPQPNELEQKKKRQTLERAKANHLSKQLQMRLQYAKLKVEYGWQRQNLNEVENLYFHHSHQRNMRQNVTQRSLHTNTNAIQSSAETVVVQSVSGPSDRNEGLSPPTSDLAPPESDSYPSRPPQDHTIITDGSSSQSLQNLTAPTPVPIPPVLMSSSDPSSTIDLSDPNILARLAELQAQVQLSLHSHSQAQSLSRQPSITISPVSAPLTTPTPGPFLPTTVLPTAGHPLVFSPFAPIVSAPPGTVTHPILAVQPNSVLSQPATSPVPTPTTTTTTVTPVLFPTTSASIPTTSIPTATSIAPAALTYDSFWSTHASTAGATRALFRTHTGFSASTAQGGNVAMLTPGGHAAVMTAEGVYVGGAGRTS